VGAKLFHVDRQTDRRTERHDEANSSFSQFCERANKKLAHNASEQSFYVKRNNIRLETRSEGAQLLLITSQADGHDLSYVPVALLRTRIA